MPAYVQHTPAYVQHTPAYVQQTCLESIQATRRSSMLLHRVSIHAAYASIHAAYASIRAADVPGEHSGDAAGGPRCYWEDMRRKPYSNMLLLTNTCDAIERICGGSLTPTIMLLLTNTYFLLIYNMYIAWRAPWKHGGPWGSPCLHFCTSKASKLRTTLYGLLIYIA
jgi:hypothetical protein